VHGVKVKMDYFVPVIVIILMGVLLSRSLGKIELNPLHVLLSMPVIFIVSLFLSWAVSVILMPAMGWQACSLKEPLFFERPLCSKNLVLGLGVILGLGLHILK
jgi:hypothetical protein